jgi:oligoendopeptidase F
MADVNAVAEEAAAFAAAYRGTINVPGGPAASHLRAALEQLETIYDRMARPMVYAALLFAADTTRPEHRNLQQQVDQRYTAIKNSLLFFDLEWLELDDSAAQPLIAHSELAAYRHYLTMARRYVPHKLSEAEEQMVNEKDVTGTLAWRNFFTELVAGLHFPFEQNGEQQQLDLETVLNRLRHHDRAVREQAFRVLYTVLGEQAQPLAFIYNTLMQDHLTMNRLRAYDDPMAQRHLSNEIDPAAVAAMMEVVEQNYDQAHRYFQLKARLLGLPRLQLYDQYAPLGDLPTTTTYAEAQTLVLDAFARFDSRFREIAADFFERHWIDAEVRPGKRGGAFCSGYPPSNHPYILCSYTDDLRDVMTLAHELGHGIHFSLASQQTIFNYSPTLPLAETASVFGEMLVFEHLLSREQDPRARLMLVCSKIEDIFATVFRQNVLTRFEQAVFARRQQERLTPEQIGACWLDANRLYYGEAVELTAGYELGWGYITHFYYMPFYCYSYVFGELLVLALYSMYREEGAAFVPRYTALLEAGGSQSPDDLLAALGVDVRTASFWQRGFAELRRLVDWAHELAQEQE